MRFTYAELRDRYETMTHRVVCRCEAATPLVGGLTAGEKGVRAFVAHHLKIADPEEAEKAYQRIMREEMGERSIAPATGELSEQLTYGINVIRRTEIGPYLGNHMIHANLKTAMSRLSMFVEKKGTKGNVAEAGIVSPSGISLLDDRPDCIYLIGPDGKPAQTYFEEFKGRVSTPAGSTSIIHHSECVPAGTQFEFEFRFILGKLNEDDIRDFLSLSMIVGIGSVKSLGHGKFRILSAEILSAEQPRAKEEKKKSQPSGEVLQPTI